MRVQWPVIALLLVLVTAVFSGCNDDETTNPPAPALTAQITATPSTPGTGAIVTLIVKGTPVGAYTVKWTASAGSFSDAGNDTTKWTAPDTEGDYSINALIGDADKAATAKLTLAVSNYTPPVTPSFVGAQTCNGCHPATYQLWAGTLHSRALQTLNAEGMGTNPTCLVCHTVGYNTSIANGGYDEQAVARLAGVQCENCHHPGNLHAASPTTQAMVLDTTAASCGVGPNGCHNGAHHPTYDEWKGSAHAHLVEDGAVAMEGGSSGCNKCHNGLRAVRYLDDPANTQGFDYSVAPTDTVAIGCPVCHDPHGNGNPGQLRNAVNDIALPDGTHPAIGSGRLCIACHNGRRAPSAINTQVQNGTSRMGPHHSLQGDMLVGVDAYNAVAPGFHFATSRHVGIQDGCVNCHNHHRPEDTPVYTGHDFRPTVQACEFCHGTIADFNDIKAKKDYDGDGTIEGIRSEVTALADTLAHVIIRATANPAFRDSLQTYYNAGSFELAAGKAAWTTVAQRAAAYNYFYVEFDGSTGIHNPTYAIQLLQQSIWSLDPNVIPNAEIMKSN
jgi:hypothetical protein